MNKKLIALAVAAGMAAPLAAQADVKLYGQAQVEVGSWGGTDKDGMSVEDNARGRVGIKASEDLGNGLKGIAKFEFKVDTSDGVAGGKLKDTSGTVTTQSDAALTKREMLVGLKGSWGQFEAGRLKSAYKYYGGVKYDPFVATVLEARSNGGMTGKVGIGAAKSAAGHNGFIDDSIAYENKWGGFALRLTYDLDDGGPRDTSQPTPEPEGGNAYSVGAKYGTKTWEVGVAGVSDDGDGENGTTDDEYSSTKVFAKFKFAGAHTLQAQYEDAEDKGDTLDVFNAGNEATGIYVDYNFKFGKNLVDLAYAQGEIKEISGSGKVDTTFMRVALKHKFSKQTSAWIGYRKSEEDPEGGTKIDTDVISLGLRKDF